MGFEANRRTEADRVDAALAGVITTGALGALGIGGTFLAPTWSQTRLLRRQESREFRRARRLILHELDGGIRYLNVLIDAFDTGGPKPWYDFPTLEWEAHRAALAAGLSDEAWKLVSQAYTASWAGRIAFQKGRKIEDGDTSRAIAEMVRESLERAQWALRDAKPVIE